MKVSDININKFLDDPALLYLEKLTGISPAEVPVDDARVYALFSIPAEEIGCAVEGIQELDTPFMRQLISLTTPKCFDDFVRLYGLGHGAGTWKNNAEDLLKSGQRDLSEVIANREDILEFLQEKGIGFEPAHAIMTYTYKGKACESGFDPADEKLLRDHGVPDWYIDSCKKIDYLSPRALAVSKLNISVRLLWFKLYHPSAFDRMTARHMISERV